MSLLVRNVLEGAFDLVEDIVDGGLEVARRSQRLAQTVLRAAASTPQDTPDGTSGGDDGAASADDLADVYGWQELILNRDVECVRCATRLAAGAKAFRGLRERPGPRAFLCTGCTRRLRQPAGD